MKIVALNNQTLLDIAIQEYGTIESVFELAMANDLSIHTSTVVGAVYQIPQAKKNTEVSNYYKNQQIKPSTKITTAQKEDIVTPSGIGYMAIGTTFIVS
jgi:hypothetical protein